MTNQGETGKNVSRHFLGSGDRARTAQKSDPMIDGRAWPVKVKKKIEVKGGR